MTEDEKQKERLCKQQATERLSKIDVSSYDLAQIDPRIETYARGIIEAPEGHNLYEQLKLLQFFRHLDTYEFRLDEVRRFFTLYEFLKFSGVRGRRSYKLTPVQAFQFACVKGFYRDETHRLCNTAIWEVPRKYSKTTSVSALAVDDLLFGDTNAQCFCAANSYNQAKVAFDEIRRVLKGLDGSLKHFKLNREKVEWLDNDDRDSYIRCLASSPDKLDGLNASVVIYDEYSQADSPELLNVLTTSMGVRENPLTAIITTASDKDNGPFAQQLAYCKGVLKQELLDDVEAYPDESTTAFIFQPDVDDEEGDPRTWHKVQPHIGVTVKESFYEANWAKAQQSADNMKDFRTKLLNVFDTNTSETWITGKQIREHYRKVDIDKIGQCETIVAVDLSTSDDLSAVTYNIYLYNEKKSHAHTEFYIPEAKLKGHPNSELYRDWADKGYIHICKGRIIDYRQIVDDILAHGRNLKILKIAFDPNKAQEFENMLIAAGGEPYLYKYKQTNFYYTKPVQSIPRLLEMGALTFDPNPIIAYCFDNATLDIDHLDNARPIKKRDNGKIDGCITVCMSVGTSMIVKRAATT